MALNFLKIIFGNGKGYAGDPLLPEDQFRTLILHECARCNRNTHAFSLIRIDLQANGNGKKTGRGPEIRQLSKSLIQRMRSTDEIGWLDNHSIGVFLPETGTNGAQSLAREACSGFTYQIYTYPWICNLGDEPGNDHISRGGSGRSLEGDTFENAAEKPQLTLQSKLVEGESDENPPSVQADTKPINSIEELVLPGHEPSWKRLYDIIGSSILLLLFSPLFAVVALYIKIVSPGPVFFRQERVGYLGRPFTMIKFRTMKMGSDNVSVHKDYLKELIACGDKTMTKLDINHDNRLIPLAGILRRSCIDELPQLINVFKGEMSLVGPRPCLDYEAREFALWQRKRFYALPGMTGLWQVSGKNRLTFKEMVRLDIRYADKKNAALDMIISIKTVPVILGQVWDFLRSRLAFDKTKPAGIKTASKGSLQHLIRQLFL